MSELVALNTQRLVEPVSSTYLGALSRALRAARLNNSFPDRRRLDGTLRGLGVQMHGGLYDGIYLDSRSGLPNMASFTRVLADKSVGLDSLERIAESRPEERRAEAAIFERMALKRRYFEGLSALALAPVDEHRVLLRRHDPGQATAMFRVELTKIGSKGSYLRVTIELTQVSSVWSHKLIDLDEDGEVASGTEALKGLVYRFASYDAETLFIRLHDLEGVKVERVHRGIVGPVLFAIPRADQTACRVLEPVSTALSAAWEQALGAGASPDLELAACFATDLAAIDVREERSNDPLSPLLSVGIREEERGRYEILRSRHPFRVYKDRKFVVTAGAHPLVQKICAEAGTKNLIYRLR